MYKIFNNLVDTEGDTLTVVPYNRTRNCTKKLYVQYSRTNTRKSFFVNRVAHRWNTLPSSIKAPKSLSVFEHMLDDYCKGEKFLFDN